MTRDFKAMLADYVEQQAWWRAQKAEEYPEDERNARCAKGLTELAVYVRGLPEDDARLERIEVEYAPPSGTDVFETGETASMLISRFRFNIPNETFAGLLARLPQALADDREAWEREADPVVKQGDIDAVVERLRKAAAKETDEEHEYGRELGIAWAKQAATPRELEDIAELMNSVWVSWSVPEDHTLRKYLAEDEGIRRFGYSSGPYFTLLEPSSLINGVIEGATEVWDQVADKL